jgi:hypothetical protein
MTGSALTSVLHTSKDGYIQLLSTPHCTHQLLCDAFALNMSKKSLLSIQKIDGTLSCQARLYDKVSPHQVPHIHTQTDGNDIWPHTAQIYNERTSTDLNLVTS